MSISLAEINVNHGGDILAEFVAENELDKPAFEILTPDQLFNLPPRRMQVDELLAVGDTCMIFGDSNAGKTFVAIDLTCAMIAGRRFADNFDIFEPLTVHYATAEGRSGLPDRFNAAFARHGITPHEQRNLSISLRTPQLFAPHGDGAAEFVDCYRTQRGDKLDVLFVDTYHNSIVGGNENSPTDVGVIMQNAWHIRDMLGCTVVLIHHANKNGQWRGTTAIPADMDAILEVKKTGRRHMLRCAKMRDGDYFPDLAFSLIAKLNSAVPFWEGKMDGDGDTRSGKMNEDISAIVALLSSHQGKKFTAKSISEYIGQAANYTDKLLKIAIGKAGVKCELLKPDAQNSSRNPWVYFLAEGESQDWTPDDGVVKEADGMDW